MAQEVLAVVASGGMNMDDIFSQFGDIFGGGLVVSEEAVAEVFVALKEAPNQSKVNLEEVANGVEKK
jgi:molecular chaperone DnaJ